MELNKKSETYPLYEPFQTHIRNPAAIPYLEQADTPVGFEVSMTRPFALPTRLPLATTTITIGERGSRNSNEWTFAGQEAGEAR
jgi:hypothetical protein